MELLLRWKRQSGNNATAVVLANALIDVGRRDVAETLASMIQVVSIICITFSYQIRSHYPLMCTAS